MHRQVCKYAPENSNPKIQKIQMQIWTKKVQEVKLMHSEALKCASNELFPHWFPQITKLFIIWDKFKSTMIRVLFSRLRNTRSGFIYSSANKFLAGVMCGIMCGVLFHSIQLFFTRYCTSVTNIAWTNINDIHHEETNFHHLSCVWDQSWQNAGVGTGLPGNQSMKIFEEFWVWWLNPFFVFSIN